MTAQLESVVGAKTIEKNRQHGDTDTPMLPEGYILRPARLDDVDAAVAMFNACSRHLMGVDEFSVDRYRSEWQIPGLDLARDVRIVEAPSGRIVGCMEVWDLSEPHVRVHLWMRVHPDHVDEGIGGALMRWTEERAQQAIAKAPAGARVSMSTGVIDKDAAAQRVFEQAGMQRIRHSWRMEIDMAAPPPPPEWPDGIAVRPMRVGQDERDVVQAVRDAFRDHWGHVERPFDDDYRMWTHQMTENPDFDPTIWYVAMNGDEIAGVSLCWPKADDDPELGWVGTLGVLRPWRRKGLGLALLRHSFGEFYRRSQRRVGLGVDAQSLTGATRLYEKAGMCVAHVYHLYEKELRPGEDLSTQSVQ